MASYKGEWACGGDSVLPQKCHKQPESTLTILLEARITFKCFLPAPFPVITYTRILPLIIYCMAGGGVPEFHVQRKSSDNLILPTKLAVRHPGRAAAEWTEETGPGAPNWGLSRWDKDNNSGTF